MARFDVNSGAYLANFVAPGAGGLSSPLDMAYSPCGQLIVTSLSSGVKKYHGTTGAYL